MESTEYYVVTSKELLMKLFSFGPMVVKHCLGQKAFIKMDDHYISCVQIYTRNPIYLPIEEFPEIKVEAGQQWDSNEMRVICTGGDALPRSMWNENDFPSIIDSFLNDNSLVLRMCFYGILGDHEVTFFHRDEEYFELNNADKCQSAFYLDKATIMIPRQKQLRELMKELNSKNKIKLESAFKRELIQLYVSERARGCGVGSATKPNLDQYDHTFVISGMQF